MEKAASGINGLDEILYGGLPRGRPTLVCGGPGCGKSLLGTEFLIKGALQYDEPGVLMTFEETAEDIRKNVASLGYDLADLQRRNKIYVDHVHIDRSQIEETGEYDLEGLFIRLTHAIQTVGARRVMLDTIEALFAGLSNESILRAELRRLFYWLKERGMTTVITAERGEGALTRQGLEEYVSDCVILLDHRVIDQISTRRLRVVKYRGTTHGTNEYPFLIDEQGITVLPITSVGLSHEAPTHRVGTGVPQLDDMLGGDGFYRGSSILVTGTAGTGKSSLAAHFANASCQRGERCLYFAFEESRSQILRNMKSIGLDLQRWVDKGLLQFYTSRPSLYGLETHLAVMHKRVREMKPAAVVIDPVSNFISASNEMDVHAMLIRLIDFFKVNKITAFFTNLTGGGEAMERTNAGISSIMDTWILLRDIEIGGERNRGIYVLKSRGMAHSNQIREFRITPGGIDLLPVYAGPEGVLTGTARLTQEAREQAAQLARRQEVERKQLDLQRRRQELDAQIARLKSEFEIEMEQLQRDVELEALREQALSESQQAVARRRGADVLTTNGGRSRNSSSKARK